MKCVVIGGSGFIGSHVVDALKGCGHDVTNVDLRPSEFAERQFQVDVRDIESLKPILKEYGKDGVYHIAAIADARKALENPVGAVDINIGGTVAVLEAARCSGVQRVFLASTVGVYNAGNHNGSSATIMEDEPITMSGGGHVYTTSKIASELLYHDFNRLYGLNFTIFRYGIPYGPRMWPGLALRTFLDNAYAGQPIKIFGDGSAVRQFVYVEDLAYAHALALKPEASAQTYNLEGDRSVTIKELAETVAKFVKGLKIEYVIDPARRGEMKVARKISNSKARQELGWKPKVTLEEGVKRVVTWYKKQHGFS
jgi:UDP-glucose 4-epimerase